MAQTGSMRLAYTFEFDEPLLKEFTTFDKGFTSVMVPGALSLGRNAGEPALPVHFVQILLPAGQDVENIQVFGKLHNHESPASNLMANPVFPYQKPVPIGEPQPIELEMNNAIYGSTTPFPAENFAGVQKGWSHGYAILSLGLHLVKYTPATGKLSWYSEMTVELTLKESGEQNPFLQNRRDDAEWVKRLVCNPEIESTYQAPAGAREYPGGLCDPADNYDYVIITTTKNGLDYWPTSGATPYNWDSLMDRHTNVDGWSCTLVTMQAINAETDYHDTNPLFNDTPAHIREFCKDAYQDWGTRYILIGADDEHVPAREMDSSAEYNVDSDIYWSNLDRTFNDDQDSYWGEEGDNGFDEYCELFIGRLTCDIPQDVSNWMKKSFKYADEESPFVLDNAAFYGGDTGWNCQGDDFEDYSAIYGTDNWLGPDPSASPAYPSWLGFQYGFETWNLENPGIEYDMTVMWTAEPPNPGGWKGGSTSAAINGLKADISADNVVLISGIAHANEYMSLDVGNSSWESSYHNTFPFFIHDYGCHCGDMDAADDGVLHSMLFHSDTELAFACVYNTGYGWGHFSHTGSSSAVQQKSFWDYMFDVTSHSGSCDNWQMGKAQAYSKDLMAPTLSWSDGSWRSIIQCCLLFGDPGQKLKPPSVPPLYMNFPQGLPSGLLPPGPEHVMQITIEAGEENYVPGTGKLHYRFDPNDPYTEVALTELGGDLLEGVLPCTKPGDEPEFYFSAEGDLGSMIYSPFTAPASVYSFYLGFIQTLHEDTCEFQGDWYVESTNIQTGEWEHADPSGTSAQPEDDHTPNGTKCFVTGASGGGSGDNDVDGGPTRLFTPTYDLSTGDAEISFYFYFYHTDYGTQQPAQIHISNDGGSTWKQAMTVGNSPSWTLTAINVADHVTPTANIKLRISVSDNPNDDVVEALVDDLAIRRYVYEPALWADGYSIPVSTGEVIGYSLDAGAANAGRQYLLLGSLSGYTPGFTLPGGATLPLNWDVLTDVVLLLLNTQFFQNFMGTLDGAGSTTATLDTNGPLDPALIGETACFAFTLGNPYDFTSNPIEVTFDP
jgi:hypothetical protein